MKIGLFFESLSNRNRTEKIFIDILMESFDTSILQLTQTDIHKQVQDFIDKNDILILHLYPFIYYDNKTKKNINITYFSENFKNIIKHHKLILKLLQKSNKPLCIMFTRSDWYNHSDIFWESIPQNAYLLGGFKKGYLNDTPQNDFIFNKFGKNITLGNDYISDNRIIPFHHIVDEKDFLTMYKQKKYDISILGVLYNRREILYNILENNTNIKLYNPKLILRLRKLLSSFDKRQYNFNHLILNSLFKNTIATSKLSYTDGSTLDMFVRKYIEIPALKSLLLCDPFEKMDDFGFINETNFLKIDYTFLDEQLENILKDEEKQQLIITNGTNLVKENFSKYTWEIRIKNIFTQILNKTFNEAKWKNGNLIIGKTNGK